MAGLSSLAQGQQQAPRRAEDNRKWGLKVPGRPPTPSEGAAQLYNRVGERSSQRLIRYDNGTCLRFGLEDRVHEFNLDVHPFGEQIALIDNAVKNIKAVRASNPTQNKEESFNDHFYNFRSVAAPPSLTSSTTLEDGSRYIQVPSRYASVNNMVSVYTEVVKLDGARFRNDTSGGDTRYGTTGGPPPDAHHKYARQAEHSSQPRQNARSRRKEKRAGERLALNQNHNSTVTGGQPSSQNNPGASNEAGGSSTYTQAQIVAIQQQLMEQNELKRQEKILQQEKLQAQTASTQHAAFKPVPGAGQQFGGNGQRFATADHVHRHLAADNQSDVQRMTQQHDLGRRNQLNFSDIQQRHIEHEFADLNHGQQQDLRSSIHRSMDSPGGGMLQSLRNSSGFDSRNDGIQQLFGNHSQYKDDRPIHDLLVPANHQALSVERENCLSNLLQEDRFAQELHAHEQFQSRQGGTSLRHPRSLTQAPIAPAQYQAGNWPRSTLGIELMYERFNMPRGNSTSPANASDQVNSTTSSDSRFSYSTSNITDPRTSAMFGTTISRPQSSVSHHNRGRAVENRTYKGGASLAPPTTRFPFWERRSASEDRR